MLENSSPSYSGADFVLHCPDCQAETFLGDMYCQECGSVQPAFAEKPHSSLHIFWGFLSRNYRVICVASGAVAAALLVLAGFVVFARIPADLQSALSENKLNDAVVLAEKLMVSRLGKLEGGDADLYSQAFFKRAQIFAGNGNYKKALLDLSKVLPAYSKMADVEQLRNVCVAGVTPAAGLIVPPAKTTQDNAPPAKEPARAAKASLGRNREQTSKLSSSSLISKDQAPVEESNLDKEEVDSEEADMAVYNRHLAEYFSRRESKSSKASSVKEPPSFSEWVQSGKSEF